MSRSSWLEDCIVRTWVLWCGVSGLWGFRVSCRVWGVGGALGFRGFQLLGLWEVFWAQRFYGSKGVGLSRSGVKDSACTFATVPVPSPNVNFEFSL